MKGKWVYLIDVGYFGIILYTVFSQILDDIDIQEIITVINSVMTGGVAAGEICTILFACVGIFIMSLFFSLLSHLLLTALYIGVKIAIKKFKKDRLEKIDFRNDNYYREKLPQYSPAVLSYIDDFEIGKKDIAATLLSLELKKKIKIKDSINIIDNNVEDLTDNEQYIFTKLKNNELKNINMLEFKSIVSGEVLNKELIQEKRIAKSKLSKMLWTTIGTSVIVTILLFVFLGTFTMKIDNDLAIFMIFVSIAILLCCVFIVPGVVIVYITSYSVLKTADPYVRSKQGREINERLEGLKKYLKDYSKMDEKTKQDLILWEEYLIYSVMFGQNDKVVEEIYSKIN